jgi:hypothetical protein
MSMMIMMSMSDVLLSGIWGIDWALAFYSQMGMAQAKRRSTCT